MWGGGGWSLELSLSYSDEDKEGSLKSNPKKYTQRIFSQCTFSKGPKFRPSGTSMLTESILEVPGLEAEEHGGDQHEEAVVEQQSVLTQLLQVNNHFILRSRVVIIV